MNTTKMSTAGLKTVITDENSHRMEKQKLMPSFLDSSKKAPLKTIQPNTAGRNGSPKSIPLKRMIHKTEVKTLKVFEDKKRAFQEMWTQTEKKQGLETGTQTETNPDICTEQTFQQAHNDSGIDQEAYDLMVKDPIPDSYWKELAEERRLSLAEALSENELLHQSMEELKEENLNLSQMAGQAEYLATVLNSLVEDEDKEKEESEENVDKDSESDDQTDKKDTTDTCDTEKCEKNDECEHSSQSEDKSEDVKLDDQQDKDKSEETESSQEEKSEETK